MKSRTLATLLVLVVGVAIGLAIVVIVRNGETALETAESELTEQNDEPESREVVVADNAGEEAQLPLRDRTAELDELVQSCGDLSTTLSEQCVSLMDRYFENQLSSAYNNWLLPPEKQVTRGMLFEDVQARHYKVLTVLERAECRPEMGSFRIELAETCDAESMSTVSSFLATCLSRHTKGVPVDRYHENLGIIESDRQLPQEEYISQRDDHREAILLAAWEKAKCEQNPVPYADLANLFIVTETEVGDFEEYTDEIVYDVTYVGNADQRQQGESSSNGLDTGEGPVADAGSQRGDADLDNPEIHSRIWDTIWVLSEYAESFGRVDEMERFPDLDDAVEQWLLQTAPTYSSYRSIFETGDTDARVRRAVNTILAARREGVQLTVERIWTRICKYRDRYEDCISTLRQIDTSVFSDPAADDVVGEFLEVAAFITPYEEERYRGRPSCANILSSLGSGRDSFCDDY